MLEKLFEGVDGLDPSLVSQLEPLFEAAVQSRVAETVTSIQEGHEIEIADLREQLVEMAEANGADSQRALAESLDDFLGMVVEEWKEENREVVLTNSLVESSQAFLTGIATLARDYNTVIPESDINVVTELTESLEIANDRLNDTLRENASVRGKYIKLQKDNVVSSLAEGMTTVGAHKLKTICESSKFEDIAQFSELAKAHKSIIESKMKETDDEEDDVKTEGHKNPKGKSEEIVGEETDVDESKDSVNESALVDLSRFSGLLKRR